VNLARYLPHDCWDIRKACLSQETYEPLLRIWDILQGAGNRNSGNSGGPMFDMNGEVIGLVGHIISKSGGSEGLGFVVIINTARELLLERRAFWNGMSGAGAPDQVLPLPLIKSLKSPNH
jgi:S1-C subfamily serine protease